MYEKITLHKKKIWCNKRRNIWHHFGKTNDAKHEAKIGANLEVKIGTYLEVKHGAKWDSKVVAKMDAILDANMVLLRMQIWC